MPSESTAESRFFADFGQGYSSEDVMAYVANGQKIYHLTESEWEDQLQEERLWSDEERLLQRKSHCAHLIWYFMFEAHKKGQSFHEGSFIVQDHNDRLYSLFAQCSFLRLSSHLVAQKSQVHLGFDSNERAPLFLSKRHALIVKLPDDLLFVKPENFSTNYADLPAHAGELVIAQARKHTGGLLKAYIGTDQDKGMRKERVPKPLIAAFTEVVGDMQNSKEYIKIAKEERIGGGIGAMYNSCMNLLQNKENLALSEEQIKKITDFVSMLLDKYDPETIQWRIGEEVHIS